MCKKNEDIVAVVDGRRVIMRQYTRHHKLRYLVLNSSGREVLWKGGSSTPEKALQAYRNHLKRDAEDKRVAAWMKIHHRAVLYHDWKTLRVEWERKSREDGMKAKVHSGAFEILTRYILPLYSLRHRFTLTIADEPYIREDGKPNAAMKYYLKRMEALVDKIKGDLNVEFKPEELQNGFDTITEMERPFRAWLMDTFTAMEDDAEDGSIEQELLNNPTLMLYLTYTFMARAFEVKRNEINNPDKNAHKAMRGCLRLESTDGGIAGLDLADLYMRHDGEDIFAAFAGLYARVQGLYHKEYLPATIARYTESSRHYARLAGAFKAEDIPALDKQLEDALKDASEKGIPFEKMRRRIAELN